MTTASLLLALSLALPASPEPPRRHDADLKKLDASLATGDAEATEALLRRLQPGLDADPRFALDAIYVFLGRRRFSEARDQWNRLAPRLQESLRGPSGAAPSAAAEKEQQRRVAEALFVQGLLTARAGPKDEALRLLQQADGYGFPPLDSPLMLLAADGLSDLQEPTLAAQAYRAFLERSPADVKARLRLGVALYSSGQVGAAEKELREVLRRGPDTPQAHYLLGAVLFEQKRADEARTHLEQELARDPACAGCLAKLAHVAYLAGDDRQCEAWLAKAAALDPEHVETNLVSGMLENRTGRYEQAIQHLSRVVEQSPAYAKAQYQLALAYQRAGTPRRPGSTWRSTTSSSRRRRPGTSGCAGRRSSPGRAPTASASGRSPGGRRPRLVGREPRPQVVRQPLVVGLDGDLERLAGRLDGFGKPARLRVEAAEQVQDQGVAPARQRDGLLRMRDGLLRPARHGERQDEVGAGRRGPAAAARRPSAGAEWPRPSFPFERARRPAPSAPP